MTKTANRRIAHSEANCGFEKLAWDSGLFGFPVARLVSCDLGQAIDSMQRSGVRLAYASARFTDHKMRAQLEALGARLVDRKLRYRKELHKPVVRPLGIESWQGRPCTPDLEDLAIASGHVSRFRVDPEVPIQVFRTLYVTWIRRSVSGEIADETFVIEESGSPRGLVTLAMVRSSVNASNTASIGLIAVAQESRGRGLGKRLMSAAEAWSIDHGASALEVVTQGANNEACALYAASGCRVIADEAIYHLWLER